MLPPSVLSLIPIIYWFPQNPWSTFILSTSMKTEIKISDIISIQICILLCNNLLWNINLNNYLVLYFWILSLRPWQQLRWLNGNQREWMRKLIHFSFLSFFWIKKSLLLLGKRGRKIDLTHNGDAGENSHSREAN